MTVYSLPAITAEPRPLRFATLASVEFRKMTDTRSGRWLIATILTIVTGVLIWKVAHPSIQPAFDNYSDVSAVFVAFLAPLIGLLAITSEWTQRTALTTFTLAPRRMPVIAAKYVASIVLTLGLLAVSVLLAGGFTLLGGAIHGGGTFDGLPTEVRSDAIIVFLQVTMAMAFGLLAVQTPLAITAFLIAPTAWAAFSSNVLKGASPWFDVFSAYDRLASSQPLEHFGQTLSAVTLWVLLPSAFGLVRSLRREVK
jgi:ABC-type transport system involved in multi-copper enzyme maturation permease subunit